MGSYFLLRGQIPLRKKTTGKNEALLRLFFLLRNVKCTQKHVVSSKFPPQKTTPTILVINQLAKECTFFFETFQNH